MRGFQAVEEEEGMGCERLRTGFAATVVAGSRAWGRTFCVRSFRFVRYSSGVLLRPINSPQTPLPTLFQGQFNRWLRWVEGGGVGVRLFVCLFARANIQSIWEADREFGRLASAPPPLTGICSWTAQQAFHNWDEGSTDWQTGDVRATDDDHGMYVCYFWGKYRIFVVGKPLSIHGHWWSCLIFYVLS